MFQGTGLSAVHVSYHKYPHSQYPHAVGPIAIPILLMKKQNLKEAKCLF